MGLRSSGSVHKRCDYWLDLFPLDLLGRELYPRRHHMRFSGVFVSRLIPKFRCYSSRVSQPHIIYPLRYVPLTRTVVNIFIVIFRTSSQCSTSLPFKSLHLVQIRNLSGKVTQITGPDKAPPPPSQNEKKIPIWQLVLILLGGMKRKCSLLSTLLVLCRGGSWDAACRLENTTNCYGIGKISIIIRSMLRVL